MESLGGSPALIIIQPAMSRIVFLYKGFMVFTMLYYLFFIIRSLNIQSEDVLINFIVNIVLHIS